jgi:uncharacterized protein (TIGR02466 family)
VTRIEFINRSSASNVASQVNLFAAPLLIFRWEEAEYWQAEILAAIEKRRRTSKGMKRTNIGGWHSKRDLPGWQDRATQMLTRWAAARATDATAQWRQGEQQPAPQQWRMDGWANVNPPGAYNRAHDHVMLNWNWSACYYVSGSPSTTDKGGAIVFEDLWSGVQTLESASRRSFRHAPSDGEMLMWPSWVSHRVESQEGEGERVSIAMNFHSPWLERSRYWTHRPGFMWRNLPWLMRPLARLRGSWDQGPAGAPPGFDIDVDETF